MYNSDNIANNIKNMCKERGVSVKKLLEDVELGFNTMSNMKTSMPKADNLAKIADYLECSVDYLLGREVSNNSHITAGDISYSNVVSGNNNVLTDNNKLSVQECDLLNIYRKADGKTQIKIMDFIYKLGEET